MKIVQMELHKYAPELNCIIFKNGIRFSTPQCKTIKEVREKYFKPAKEYVRAIQAKSVSNKGTSYNKSINIIIDSENMISKNKDEKLTIKQFKRWFMARNADFSVFKYGRDTVTYDVSFKTAGKFI